MTTTIIESRSASEVPGSTLREMTCEHTSRDGRSWPAGTQFQPHSAGRDRFDYDYQTVTIHGESVTFTQKRRDAGLENIERLRAECRAAERRYLRALDDGYDRPSNLNAARQRLRAAAIARWGQPRYLIHVPELGV